MSKKWSLVSGNLDSLFECVDEECQQFTLPDNSISHFSKFIISDMPRSRYFCCNLGMNFCSNQCTYFTVNDNEIYTGEFILNKDFNSPLPELHSKKFPSGLLDANQKINRIIELVDIFFPLLRIKILTDNEDECTINYRYDPTELNNATRALSDYCCGFISTMCCVLAALDDYDDFKVLKDNPVQTFKRISNMISSFTPYHTCTTICRSNFSYTDVFPTENVAIGTLYVADSDGFESYHTFCVYNFSDEWIIILDSWSDEDGERPLWGRIVSRETFNVFLDYFQGERNPDALEYFIDNFFLVPCKSKIPFSTIQLGFKAITEKDLIKRYPLKFAGNSKRKKYFKKTRKTKKKLFHK
jgi:hypothetical protein